MSLSTGRESCAPIFWVLIPLVLACPNAWVLVIDTIISVDDWIPVINSQTILLEYFECPVNLERVQAMMHLLGDHLKKYSHNILRRDRVPRVNSSRGPVGELEWVIFARVASGEGLIICVKNHAGTWLCAHVKIDVPSWVEWVCRLNPTTDITQSSVCVGRGDVQADVVNTLGKGAILGTSAGVVLGDVDTRSVPLGIPVTQKLGEKKTLLM